MAVTESYHFDLQNFEGPLDYLVHLIQKNEIDIYGVQLSQIVEQFLALWKQKDVNSGAEFIGSAASLVYLKSRMLLPKHEQALLPVLEEDDPSFEIIHQLIEYCRFKQAAKELAQREQTQTQFFYRGVESHEAAKRLGIEHLSLDDLAVMFKQVMARARDERGLIEEEEWLVSDKILFLREKSQQHEELPFSELLHDQMCRGELIVTFLALLELIKLGEIGVGRRPGEEEVLLIFKTLRKSV